MSDLPPLAATSRALRGLEIRQEAAAHNLANASTPGFRAVRVFSGLSRDGGGPVVISARDATSGSVTITGRPLDLAVEGPGFLVVSADGGEALSRAGSLSVDDSGVLVDAGGRPVLGTGGPVIVPPGELHITTEGEIYADGVRIDRLRVEAPGPGASLPAAAGGLLLIPEGQSTMHSPGSRIRQGRVEESNVNPVRAMTDMIEIQRSFATLQRSIQVMDGVMERVVNDIGRLR